MRRLVLKKALLAGVAVMVGATSMPAWSAETLTVWWVKGFYRSEDEALYKAIKGFEEKTGVTVELSQYAVQDMIPKTVAALDSGTPPDIAYSDTYDFQVGAKWAFENRLEDLTGVLEPMKDHFDENTLSTTYLYNDTTKERAYYSFPLKRQTMHIEYWIDMLKEAGFEESAVPEDWEGFWNFWCNDAQKGYRSATGQRAFGIGQPMGVDSTDSFFSFLTFADAYNVKLVDDEGKLLVDDPSVKEGLVGALTDYTMPYTEGCTAPSATSWKDPDNNVAFHNKTTMLTHNATISIAGKWYDDMTNPALTEDERDLAKKNYYELIRTRGFPNKPDGSPMVYRSAVKTGVIFQQSRNKERAKEFLAFLMQPENLQPYVEGSLGRWFPVTKEGMESPFWQEDPHRKSVYDQFKAGTVTFEFTKNWKFTTLNNENVWAKAMNRVVNENVSVEDAVDEMIARIKEVAGT
ncbi:MAG TPA: ABC transporter substrate-binding protein [Geminicoccus sp.]|jgi:multiple sugar transport system substrate-binding protein|uniref:ABC transporter substrate-binding protein n=1 Tax=Geminicoccus sp. TaxID=2024832 RepID=UPI002E2FA293|nr:ABC transporter substrate-binding protein [Geminicoccus sp.]HEX2525677.1 ABC transporter substrate-binding protein [Geminicoccus sp.]